MEPQTNTNESASEPTASQHGVGPLVGALIVIAVLVLGGVYFLTNKAQMPVEQPPVILGDVVEEKVVPPPSNSDAVNDINADIDATDLDSLEADINADLQTIEANL